MKHLTFTLTLIYLLIAWYIVAYGSGLTINDFKQNAPVSDLITKENMDQNLSKDQATKRYGLDTEKDMNIFNSLTYKYHGYGDSEPIAPGGYIAHYDFKGTMLSLTKCVEYMDPPINLNDVNEIQNRFIRKYGTEGLNEQSPGNIRYYIVHKGKCVSFVVTLNGHHIEYFIEDMTDRVKQWADDDKKTKATAESLKEKYK